MHRISKTAAKRLADLKRAFVPEHLRDPEIPLVRNAGWPEHGNSTSVMLEFLIWWFEQTREEGLTRVMLSSFRPETRNGRPVSGKHRQQTPAELRKAQGLERNW
jgi:hypothetical protein